MAEELLFRHAMGGIYEKIGEARHTVTNELLVVYKALVVGRLYCMPIDAFEGFVDVDGEMKLHFAPLKSDKDKAKEKPKKS